MAPSLPFFSRSLLFRKEGGVISAGHHSLLRAGGASSFDYVQDGLYYQLDGIENAGRGVHSATATTWTDLTGNGRDATFINAASGLVWQDDAAYLYGKTHDGMAKISGLPSMTAFTFEIVCRMDAKEDYARMYESEAYGTGAKRFASLFGTANYPSAMSFALADDGDQNYNLVPVSTSARSYAVTPNVSGSSYSARVCVNGAFAQSGTARSVSGVSAATYIDVANRSNSTNRGFDGAVYAIRVYNRILTDAEIAANYAIDKARFNLP